MIEIACERCGVVVQTWPSRVKRGKKYCGSSCADAAKKGKPSYERTPEHREKMRAKFKGRAPIWHAIEAAANARRGVPPSELARQVAAERWSGEGNPKWADGRASERYAPGFGRRLRKTIIERDGVCVDCGQWDDRPRAMHVHHIDGSRDNHSLDNLVLLCVQCHKDRHVAQRREAKAA